jgi:acylglycerol lipase
MPSTSDTARLDDGTRLLTRCWRPASPPWAAVLLVHGLGDHSGRYERTGQLLSDAGVEVRAFDLPGQGGSGGERGDLERWTIFTDAVTEVLDRMGAAEPDGPRVLLGHSLGALVALDAVFTGQARPDLLVLSAPALRDGVAPWVHAVAPLAARVAPRRVVRNTWDGSYLSRDPEVGRASAADPLNAPGATLRLAAAGFAAQSRLRAEVARRRSMPMPTLVIHGGDDRLVPTVESEPLAALEQVTRIVYPGLRHETFMEPEGPAVVADVVAWLQARVGDPAATRV